MAEEIKIPLKIQDVEKAVSNVYLLKDKGAVRLLCAAAIANRLHLSDKPVWVLLLAGSSAGKTALLQLLDTCGKWIVPIDTLTPNTFASGLQRDEEVSLLWKANNGVLIFKDFTTITSMNEEGLREIMGQLRAIYDGTFNKKTGNGNDVDWKGKVGIIAGGTIATQRKMRQFSEQGERFINYVLDVADPKEITRRAMQNQKDLRSKEEALSAIVSEFINERLSSTKGIAGEISDEIQEEMIDVANFCTLARSPVIMSKKDPSVVEFVPDREMPPRVAMMLTNIAVALMLVCKETTMSELNATIIYKIALDCIPVERRMVLRLLAKYREASTKNLAMRLNYTTETVRGWLAQLNALKIVDRSSNGSKNDMWTLKKEYKDTVVKYENIQVEDVPLEPTEEEIANAYVEPSRVDTEELEGINFDWGPFGDNDKNDKPF